mgnify:CR=1 FL=1
MIRRLAREVALQALFQIDFTGNEVEQAVVNGVVENKEAIDATLNSCATDWTVERMPATDRNILRVAVFEMRHEKPALAAGVAINEAVEIAKAYGTEESPRFINGVLGKLARK